MKGRKGLLDALREKGYRLTPQRMIVVEAIEASNDHISAEEIRAKSQLKYPYINMSTVYRTLELLTEQGLVTETDLGGGRSLYHPTGKADHHHLVCKKCGRVTDIDVSLFQPLKDEIRAKYGFNADLEHIGIFGICTDCEM